MCTVGFLCKKLGGKNERSVITVFNAVLCLNELVSLHIKLKFEVGLGNDISITFRYSQS